MTVHEKKQARSEAVKKAEGILATAKDAGREMNDEEFKGFKAAMDEADRLKAEVEAEEKAAAERRANVQSLTASLSTHQQDIKANVGRRSAPDSFTTNGPRIEQRDMLADDPNLGFKHFGDFAATVHAAGLPGGGDAQQRILEMQAAAGTGLNMGSKADGAVFVPPAFSKTIEDKLYQGSDSLLGMTDNLGSLPYGVESMEFPVPNETSRANGSRAGGIQGFWKGELSQMQSSQPTFKSVKYEPSQLYVFAYVSDKLLQNAGMLNGYLARAAADEINFKTGDAIINGTGAGQPRGVLSGATDKPRVQVAKENGQAAATVVLKNIQKMYARMPARLLAGAKWFINQDVWVALFDLTQAVGTGGVPVFLPNNSISGAPSGSLMGLPIVPIEYAATLGTEGDIFLWNPKAYGTLTRGGVDSAMSMHLKFDYAQTAFRFIFELDGQPWHSDSLTPYKGTNKQSSIVTLATRA